MPGLVGGFGNKKNLKNFYSNEYNYLKDLKKFYFHNFYIIKKDENNCLNKNLNISNRDLKSIKFNNDYLGPYLAGLIEGDGTIAIHDINSSSKKYNPMIIIVFKKADLPLANYLQNLTNCGSVTVKKDRGYVLWEIKDIIGTFTIFSIINGYMRSPKIEALNRGIEWINNYISKNKNSKIKSTIEILSKINNLEIKSLDFSDIEKNYWLSGFSDADANFSINIYKRSDKNSYRVQLYYRLEIKQNYHREDLNGIKASFYPLISKIGRYLDVNVYSRSRSVNDKIFYSYTIISHNKNSNLKLNNYFENYPLLSSKFLDYKDWNNILELQNINPDINTYLNKALIIRKNFNSTRSTYSWYHLNNCKLKLKKD